MRLQENLQIMSNEANIFSTIVRTIDDNASLSSSLYDEEKLAKVYEQKCNTLKGAVKFKPMVLNHTEFSFKYIGSNAQTCVVLSFFIASPSSVSIVAKTDPTLFEQGGQLNTKRRLSVLPFLQIRMKCLCEYMCQQFLYSTCDIPRCLRRFGHLLGRLESTGAELAKLNERYCGKISLSHITNSSSFRLRIRFLSQNGLALLGISFEISDAYPFSPLSVHLDTYNSEVNVEDIQKLMVKNAKSGFGYLSRICDVVEVSLS